MKGSEADGPEHRVSFGLEDYSKAELVGLLKLYARLYIALDGFWYLSMKGEFGDDKALEHDLVVWEKMYKREIDGVTSALGVRDRDIPAFIRVLTIAPWFPRMQYEVDIKSNSYAVLTVTHCPTLQALEKEGEGREERICRVVDVDYFRKCGKHFNPNIEVTALKLPPRKSRDEICCQWKVELK